MIKHIITLFLLLSFFVVSAQNQKSISPSTPSQIKVQNAAATHYNSEGKLNFVEFEVGKEPLLEQFDLWLQRQFQLPKECTLVEVNRISDDMGYTHIRYKLHYHGFEIHDGMLVLHTKDRKVFSFNGIVPAEAIQNYQAQLTETQALSYALKHVNAQIYKWEIPGEEQFIKTFTKNPNATYFPKAKTVLYHNNPTKEYHLTYKFDIYAHQPLSREEVFVDATTGAILFENKLIHHVDSVGTAVTQYSGNKTITTDYYNNNFRLRENGRGLGIQTYDMNQSTNYGSAVDFIDSNNYWNNTNTTLDQIATDAHWGMEMTYDYYMLKHNRNSIDGNGLALISYVHYDQNYANAFWNGNYMTFGDGSGSIGPLVALDIVGHEISHGLTQYTANLDYLNESGAMNEAFSDIFGTAIEHYGKPGAGNWLMGENIGSAFRSMSNPNQYGDPDTYLGTNYYLGTQDNGGVHTNCGVLSYCFYLMAEGGSGVNDLGNSYNISGIGIDSASRIAFRALTVYLVNSSQHADARFYFIKSAIDLFGGCTPAVEAVTNAFYAVGIGSIYSPTVVADFSTDLASFCQAPATVDFKNLSSNSGNFVWNFGDGGTSTQYNPSHTYTSVGTFNVQLIALGGNCGSDTVIKNSFVSVSPDNPCPHNMPNFGTQTLTSCSGLLFDNGGASNYTDNTNVMTTLSPVGASYITLTFSSFDFESNYDYLYIYDGPNTSSTLIGQFDGTSLPNGGTVVSTGGSLTLRQTSDQAITGAGFKAFWQCSQPNAAPTTQFISNDTLSCDGTIQFTDKSLNSPTSWVWHFGDGDSSVQQNPTHQYLQSGYYNVSLAASNTFGQTQIIKPNLIHIELPQIPQAADVSLCNGGNALLQAIGNGQLVWFSTATGTTSIDTGNTLSLNNITQTSSYFVESQVSKPSKTVGMTATLSDGGVLDIEHYLVFDVFNTFILKSVKVYANSTGSRTITLQDGAGNILKTTIANVVGGWNTISLNYTIQTGVNYRLAGKNFHRKNANVNYPYTIAGLVNIKSSSASTNPQNYYYYFYEWEVATLPCTSTREEVKVFVNSSAPSASFQYSNTQLNVSFSNTTNPLGSSFWSFGDGSFSSDINPSHTFATGGIYTVKLKVDNGCGVDSTQQILDLTGVGIYENSDANLELFPNPTQGLLHLKWTNGSSESKLELLDVLGQSLMAIVISESNGSLNLDLTTFADGIYFIKVQQSPFQNQLYKVIKQSK